MSRRKSGPVCARVPSPTSFAVLLMMLPLIRLRDQAQSQRVLSTQGTHLPLR
jgi:hypothetical protein